MATPPTPEEPAAGAQDAAGRAGDPGPAAAPAPASADAQQRRSGRVDDGESAGQPAGAGPPAEAGDGRVGRPCGAASPGEVGHGSRAEFVRHADPPAGAEPLGDADPPAGAGADHDVELSEQLERRRALLQRSSVVLFVAAGILVVVAVLGIVLGGRHHDSSGTAASSAGVGAAAGRPGPSGKPGDSASAASADPLGPATSFPGTVLTTGPFAGFGEVAAQLVSPDGTVADPCLLAATDETHREQGLMHVTDPSLAGHAGMVFTYPVAQHEQFWMRNTPLPLAIAFYGADGRFVSGTTMVPCGDSASCPNYHAAGAYTLAVEVPRGQPLAAELVAGSTLRLTGACDAPREQTPAP